MIGLKHKYSIFRILLLVFAVVIFAEIIILLSLKLSSKSIMDNAEIIGVISKTDSKVYVNDIKVPAYGYKNKVYIAAEDLIPFGVELINTNGKNSDLTIILNAESAQDIKAGVFSKINSGEQLAKPSYSVYINEKALKENFYCAGYNIIPVEVLNPLFDSIKNIYKCTLSLTTKDNVIEGSKRAEEFISSSLSSNIDKPKIIVLDPGHGKASQSMSDEEKKGSGWIYNSSKNQWGEWRHWKSHSATEDCTAIGCNGRVTPNGSCWYPIYNGDRDTEPEINLKNCLAAKKYLENMGYTVRLTRTSNEENPSITQRLSYCYPNKNISSKPDAEIFVCIHSNAGGGSGSAYIELSEEYDQKNISESYVSDSNTLGKYINDEITASTSLKSHGNGKIAGIGALIAFCKSPVVCGYLEIGFYDNQNDLNILQSESEKIGSAIANGIDKYLKAH